MTLVMRGDTVNGVRLRVDERVHRWNGLKLHRLTNLGLKKLLLVVILFFSKSLDLYLGNPILVLDFQILIREKLGRH